MTKLWYFAQNNWYNDNTLLWGSEEHKNVICINVHTDIKHLYVDISIGGTFRSEIVSHNSNAFLLRKIAYFLYFFDNEKNPEFARVEKSFPFLKIYIKYNYHDIFLMNYKGKTIWFNKWGTNKLRNEVVKRVGVG